MEATAETPRPLSRQALAQRAHLEAGLCRVCSAPHVEGAQYCARCLERNRHTRHRREGGQPWRKGGKGRVPFDGERITRTPIGAWLYERRQSAGLSTYDVSVRSGLSPQTFAAIEAGRTLGPSWHVLKGIARAFGITPAELADELTRAEEAAAAK